MGSRKWTLPSIELVLATRRWPPYIQLLLRRHPVFFPAPVFRERDSVPALDRAQYPPAPVLRPQPLPETEDLTSISLLDLNETVDGVEHGIEASASTSSESVEAGVDDIPASSDNESPTTSSANAPVLEEEEPGKREVTTISLTISRYVGDTAQP
ncbi:hypothetical protein SISSUDRAFT_1065529 [Sistotremastrum suecicum HHB10207 ss-3]|uniref:Uncharacterized protein n=1 Tax=Sistotremastrum suecicum HHB10207 ss-3 TaxID=1314776 RepID=A0A165ZD52_9AGAM|nr:hypothetical protein SISSUDRAFT_1065529 [Sistotremastrum suecicum HHB10207 ss-3]